MRLNMTALTGLYTPYFEAVYFGARPDLGPDPVLIATLLQWGTTVAVVTWATGLTLGLDWAASGEDDA